MMNKGVIFKTLPAPFQGIHGEKAAGQCAV